MKKPVIGITCNFLPNVEDALKASIAAPGQTWELLAEDYVQSVVKAGGCPVLLPVHADFDEIVDVLDLLDGIILTGGHDVSPQLFGERFNVRCGLLDTIRDEYERSLINWADAHDTPLLGICRGIQILNVTFGGTLCQDIPNSGRQSHSLWSGDRNNGTHLVKFPEGSPLRSIFGCEEAWVNSFHHQAVRRLAECLQVAAISDFDEIVEAAYRPDRSFMLAVQWHPEMMYRSELQAKLFKAFVNACAAKK